MHLLLFISVHLYVSILTFVWVTSTFTFCLCMSCDHCSYGIETQRSEVMLMVSISSQFEPVSGTFILKWGQFSNVNFYYYSTVMRCGSYLSVKCGMLHVSGSDWLDVFWNEVGQWQFCRCHFAGGEKLLVFTCHFFSFACSSMFHNCCDYHMTEMAACEQVPT